MTRRMSLNARLAQDAAHSAEIEVVLIMVEHPDLAAPIRLSTDNADRISVEPLIYGTRSTWRGSDPATEPFLFILASAEMPSDLEGAPAEASIVIEAVTGEVARLLRSFTSRATVHMAVVLASSPDIVEFEATGMRLMLAEGGAGEVTATIGREPVEEESLPGLRFTKDRFPGLHR